MSNSRTLSSVPFAHNYIWIVRKFVWPFIGCVPRATSKIIATHRHGPTSLYLDFSFRHIGVFTNSRFYIPSLRILVLQMCHFLHFAIKPKRHEQLYNFCRYLKTSNFPILLYKTGITSSNETPFWKQTELVDASEDRKCFC